MIHYGEKKQLTIIHAEYKDGIPQTIIKEQRATKASRDQLVARQEALGKTRGRVEFILTTFWTCYSGFGHT